MDWRCGASDRTLALQVWSPEFKPQSYQEKKKMTSFPPKYQNTSKQSVNSNQRCTGQHVCKMQYRDTTGTGDV
jgi:hypothetical protein